MQTEPPTCDQEWDANCENALGVERLTQHLVMDAEVTRHRVDPESRRDYVDFVTAAFEGARPTVASALTREIRRSRFAGLAQELGFGVNALPSQLDVHQWAGLFHAAGPSLTHAAPTNRRTPGPALGARPRRGRRRAGDRPVP